MYVKHAKKESHVNQLYMVAKFKIMIMLSMKFKEMWNFNLFKNVWSRIWVTWFFQLLNKVKQI